MQSGSSFMLAPKRAGVYIYIYLVVVPGTIRTWFLYLISAIASLRKDVILFRPVFLTRIHLY